MRNQKNTLRSGGVRFVARVQKLVTVLSMLPTKKCEICIPARVARAEANQNAIAFAGERTPIVWTASLPGRGTRPAIGWELSSMETDLATKAKKRVPSSQSPASASIAQNRSPRS